MLTTKAELWTVKIKECSMMNLFAPEKKGREERSTKRNPSLVPLVHLRLRSSRKRMRFAVTAATAVAATAAARGERASGRVARGIFVYYMGM